MNTVAAGVSAKPSGVPPSPRVRWLTFCAHHSRWPFSTTLSSHHVGRFLELHMYMTSALGKNDMKAIGLQMALDLVAKKEKKDSITGLQTRTQPGRPDWRKVKPGWGPSPRDRAAESMSGGRVG